MQTSRYHLRGATLIELVLTIIIISAALTGLLQVVNITTKHSADPLIQQQAVAIAESYLEEIILLPIDDPDGNNVGESRATFDNITDYHQLNDVGVKDHNNQAIPELAQYNVSVTVSSGTNELINGIQMTAITVTVHRQNQPSLSLTSYRAL